MRCSPNILFYIFPIVMMFVCPAAALSILSIRKGKLRSSYGDRFRNGVEAILSGSGYDSRGDRHYYADFDPANPNAVPQAMNNGVANQTDYDRYDSFFTKAAYQDFTFEGAYSSRTKGIPTGSFGTDSNDLGNDGLKIDRSFIDGMGTNGENQQIVRTIMLLARDMNIDVIAEGLETQVQMAQIKSLNCQYGRGSLFSKTVAGTQARTLIERGQYISPAVPGVETETVKTMQGLIHNGDVENARHEWGG